MAPARDPKGEKPWEVIPIASEPTTHRMRWGDVLGTGKKQLVVAPLQGRGTKGPNWGEGQGVRLLVFSVPPDPAKDKWPVEVANDSLHTTHNLQLVDFNKDGHDDIVVAGWEGVFVLRRGPMGGWESVRLGSGNQESSPFKGSSEVKVGKLSDGATSSPRSNLGTGIRSSFTRCRPPLRTIYRRCGRAL